MSKLIHLTRPGLAGALGPRTYGPEGPVHDLIRCQHNDDGDDVYAGSDATPKAPRVDDVPGISSLLERANNGDRDAKDEIIARGVSAVPALLAAARSDEYDHLCELVKEIRDPEAVPHLLEALQDKDHFARYFALFALQEIGDPLAIDPIMECLSDSDEEVRARAADVIGSFGYRPAIDPLISLLEHEDSEVVESACRSLGKLPAVRSVIPLLRLLSGHAGHMGGADPDASMEAIAAIGNGAVPILLDVLNTSEDGEMRKQASYALSESYLDSELLTTEESRKIIIQALQDSVEDVIVACVNMMEYPGGFEPLAALLTHADTEVRQEAGRVLGMIDKKRAAQEFVRVLENDDSGIAKDAGNKLAALGVEVADSIVDGFAGASDLKSARINSVLRRIAPSSSGLNIRVKKRFDDADVDIRRGVLRFLVDNSGRNLPLNPEDVAKDTDPSIREMLIEWACKYGSPEHIAFLDSLASDPHPEVNEGAPIAIQIIRKREADREAEMEKRQRMADEEAAERAKAEKLEAAAKEQRGVSDRVEAATQGIIVSLSQMLGLKYNLRARVRASDYVHATVFAVEETPASSNYALRLLPEVTVDLGPTVEYAQEVLKTLNFLVHHEIAHALQTQKMLPHPTINAQRYQLIGQKHIAHFANEMYLDRLAFDMGVKMYVHGDGDAVFGEEIREIIVISAIQMLANLMYEDVVERGRELVVPAFARLVATLRESASSSVIPTSMQRGLTSRATAFYKGAIKDMDAPTTTEFDRLIEEYRRIFKESSLEV